MAAPRRGAVRPPGGDRRACGRSRARRAVSALGLDARRWRHGPSGDRDAITSSTWPSGPRRTRKRATGKSTQAGDQPAFATLAKSAKEDDVVFVVLIGHGTFDGKVGEVQPAGPGHDAGGFRAAAEEPAGRSTSCSSTPPARAGRSSRSLSGPGRTIVTATRTGAERFATLFGGYFVDALFERQRRRRQEPPHLGARGVRCRTSLAWRVRTSRKASC